jgi:phospholipid-transporting ATPase
MSPKQKSELVKIVKSRQPETITLAIGDGANDVNMISTANIGVGILGKEGLQAAKVSDYAIANFCFLRRLLFVHGRECYRKNSFLVIYTYYKNIIIIGPQIAFGYYCIFSSQSIYEPRLYESYNILFTALPLIWFAISDKEYTNKKLEKEPHHYIRGIKGKGFSSFQFWKGVIYGLLQGMGVLIALAHVEMESTFDGKTVELSNLGI